jgi:hypothetical protein
MATLAATTTLVSASGAVSIEIVALPQLAVAEAYDLPPTDVSRSLGPLAYRISGREPLEQILLQTPQAAEAFFVGVLLANASVFEQFSSARAAAFTFQYVRDRLNEGARAGQRMTDTLESLFGEDSPLSSMPPALQQELYDVTVTLLEEPVVGVVRSPMQLEPIKDGVAFAGGAVSWVGAQGDIQGVLAAAGTIVLIKVSIAAGSALGGIITAAGDGVQQLIEDKFATRRKPTKRAPRKRR